MKITPSFGVLQVKNQSNVKKQEKFKTDLQSIDKNMNIIEGPKLTFSSDEECIERLNKGRHLIEDNTCILSKFDGATYITAQPELEEQIKPNLDAMGYTVNLFTK